MAAPLTTQGMLESVVCVERVWWWVAYGDWVPWLQCSATTPWYFVQLFGCCWSGYTLLPNSGFSCYKSSGELLIFCLIVHDDAVRILQPIWWPLPKVLPHLLIVTVPRMSLLTTDLFSWLSLLCSLPFLLSSLFRTSWVVLAPQRGAWAVKSPNSFHCDHWPGRPHAGGSPRVWHPYRVDKRAWIWASLDARYPYVCSSLRVLRQQLAQRL